MPLATEVKKLAESKPFYAVAGAGDFAVEKLRELPEQIQKLQGRREEIREVAKDLPEEGQGAARRQGRGLRQGLPREGARSTPTRSPARAAKLYEEFASRGRKVVSKASGGAALELEEVSEAAEPARATARRPGRTPAPAPRRPHHPEGLIQAVRTRATPAGGARSGALARERPPEARRGEPRRRRPVPAAPGRVFPSGRPTSRVRTGPPSPRHSRVRGLPYSAPASPVDRHVPGRAHRSRIGSSTPDRGRRERDFRH